MGASSLEQTRLQFWKEFIGYMNERSQLSFLPPTSGHYLCHIIDMNDFDEIHLCAIAATRDLVTKEVGNAIGVELYFGGDRAESYFDLLAVKKPEIEREIGERLIWHNQANAKAHRIYTRHLDDFRDRAQWPRQHEWLREHLEIFHRVLVPRVEQIVKAR